jgi:hypothetical protein
MDRGEYRQAAGAAIGRKQMTRQRSFPVGGRKLVRRAHWRVAEAAE